MRDPSSQFSRYRALLSQSAQSALEATAGAMGDAPSPGALAVVVPVVRGESAVKALGALAHGPGRLTTLTGQSRPVYLPLAAHLARDALAKEKSRQGGGEQADVARLAQMLESEAISRQTVSLVLWQSLCVMEAAALLDDRAMHDAAAARVDAVLADAPAASDASGAGPLHAQRSEDQLDHWTYRELSGLHALANLAHHADRDDWWQAVHRIVLFHLEHTQPDYTTCEPWGVHAFLRWPETVVFADQQLHDTQTNMTLEGASAALLPALLLSDAANFLSSVSRKEG